MSVGPNDDRFWNQLPPKLRNWIMSEIEAEPGDLVTVSHEVWNTTYVFTNRSKAKHTRVSADRIEDERKKEQSINAAAMVALMQYAKPYGPNRIIASKEMYFATDFAAATASHKPQDSEKIEGMILILAGNYDEAKEYADGMLGVGRSEWHYVVNYRDMIKYRNSSVHIIGTARAREDFEAIQGLFILGKHTVLDLEADE